MIQALNKFDIAPPLQSLLLEALDALIHGKPVESIPFDPLVEEVAEAQAQVGWHQIIKGRFVCEWTQAQDRYYKGTIWNTQTNDVLNHKTSSDQSKAVLKPVEFSTLSPAEKRRRCVVLSFLLRIATRRSRHVPTGPNRDHGWTVKRMRALLHKLNPFFLQQRFETRENRDVMTADIRYAFLSKQMYHPPTVTEIA
jgi:hypothetical protein